jgi:proline iminopeptidase
VTADDGVRLWTEAGGSGAGLILLHGGPGLWDYLGPLAATLEEAHTVVRYDQRGAGRSDHDGPYSLERFVADCEGVRDASGLERAVVAGHSWGAALALLYALAHPDRVRGVLYISGIGFDWVNWKASFHRDLLGKLTTKERARLLVLDGRDELSAAEEHERTRLRWITDYVDRELGEAQISRMLAAGFAVNHTANRTLSAELEATAAAEWHQRISAVTCPVLVVQGAADPRPVAAVDGMVAALPTRERVILQAGHFPWVDDPLRFGEVVNRWLSSL